MFQEYKDRLAPCGTNIYENNRHNSIAVKEQLFKNSQSYKEVKVNGRLYDARITQDVRDSVKGGNGNYLIEFRDNISFPAGTYIEIITKTNKVDFWIIIDVLDDLFFPQALIKKCSYNLKWINNEGKIVQRQIAFDDSSRFTDSIKNYGNKTNIPDGSIGIFLPFDEETKYLKNDCRFLIDKAVTEDQYPDAYIVTNRNALTRISNEHGIIYLVLTNDQFNPIRDDKELMIADYYKVTDENLSDVTEIYGVAQAKITYSGTNKIVMDTPDKKFNLCFYDYMGNPLPDEIGQWEIKYLPEFSQYIVCNITGNQLLIKAMYNENLNGYTFKVIGKNADGSISTDIKVKVVSGI